MAIDVEKQIAYWITGAAEDWEVAKELVADGKIRHGLFFAHLSLEKTIKARVCGATQDYAPKIHNLVRLAELAGLVLEAGQTEFLGEMNAFNLQGRYPDMLMLTPPPEKAQEYIHQADEVRQWLTSQLSK